MLRPSAGETLRAWLLSALVVHGAVAGNPDAKRLYDDLLSNYNKLVRPVVNTSDVLRVCIKLKLSQLIDVLSSKSGISNGFSQQLDTDKKSGLETASLLEGEVNPDSNKTELQDDLMLHFGPYVKTYEGAKANLLSSFASGNLEGNFMAPSAGGKGKRTAQASTNISEVDTTKRKNSSSSNILKQRKKIRKVSRSEAFPKKYKYLDSFNECKKIWGSCRFFSEEDFDNSLDPDIIPAYLVVKLMDDSGSDLVQLEKHNSNKSFRLVFPKEKAVNLEEKEPSTCSTTIKMKDKFNQTHDVRDQCIGVNSSEIVNCTLEHEKKGQESKNCTTCLKMNDYFRFQREFNGSLLAQMENMLGQLTMMIKLLHEALKHKNNSDRDLNKEGTLQNFWKMKASGDAFAAEADNKPSCAFVHNCMKPKDSKFSPTGGFEENIETRITCQDCKIFEDDSSYAPEENPETIFSSYPVNTDLNKHLQKKTESVPDKKSKCHEKKTSSGEKKNIRQLAKKNEINELKKEFPERKEKANKCPAVGGDQKTSKKNFIEQEDADYDGEEGDEMRSDNDKMAGENEGDEELINEMSLCKNQFQLIVDEGKRESSRNDIFLRSEEDKTIKFSSTYSAMNLKNQIMTTNLWVEQSWYDYKLRWDPKEYGGVHMLHVPSDHIWRPDIVLYNNADGNFEVTLATKATIYHQGLVEWKPPAIYKSSCEIDVEYFPFDEQTCVLKFGSWTYDGFKAFKHSEFLYVKLADIKEFSVLYAKYLAYFLHSADGNYEVTLMTKARVSHTGLVEWQPPAVYKSSCAIDVEFFPYDIQTCVLKLGSWTYDGFKVDLRHMDEKAGSNVVEVGVDLSEFYMSVEWDILEVPAVRNEKFYTCCDEPYLDITFNITMRRKTLFYTVNIIIPCMGISFLTVLTFYLPSDSGEKVTLSISILISLHVFFLLVVEIIPPTSLVVPLLGKYLIFAMILVSISICVTVVVLNVHFRSPQTHRMAPWVKRVFIHILPRLLVMRRPQYHFEPHRFMSRRVIMQTVKGKEIQTSYYPYPYQTSAGAENPKLRDVDSVITRQRTISKEDFSPESLADGDPVFGSCQIHGPPPQSESEELSLSGVEGAINNGEDLKSPTIKNPAFSHSMCPPEVHKSCFCVRFIAEHTKMLEDSTKVKEDWKYVAMVLDRLFLWIFTLAVLVGTAGIILQAPTLYDDRIPIDKQFAEIQTSTVIRCPPQ